VNLLSRALAASSDDASVERILDAALDQLIRYGPRRTTMDDVARGAGLGRATVYRRFPQKDQLFEAVLLRECRRFLEQLTAALAAASSLEEKIVEGYVATMRLARGHPLIQQLVRLEPETTLPYLTSHGAPVIAMCRGFVAQLIGDDGVDEPEVTAEILVRLVHSLVLTPDGVIPVEADAAREFARRHLLPAAVPR
jgi:AcrR family transcriptional regulator